MKIGLVGLGTFGRVLLKYVRRLQEENRLDLAAVCDVSLDKCLAALGKNDLGAVRAYSDYDRFLRTERQLDAVIISTPIPVHAEMGVKAMEAGHNVLLEKPPAVTLQDMDHMIAVRRRTGKVFAIGFQHTSERSFVRLLELVGGGTIGRVRAVCAAGVWKRTRGYFTRSPWVGKLLLDGKYVLDGTINNPFSHLLMNSLILSGLQDCKEASPEWVQAELYRANDIECEDTSCLRAKMENGVDVLCWATICGPDNGTPFIVVEGSEGKASWDYNGKIKLWDGHDRLKNELIIESDRRYDHLINFTQYLEGHAHTLSCPLEATRKFVLAANLAFESAGKTRSIGEAYTEKRNEQGQTVEYLSEGEDYLCIKNIESIIKQAIARKALFSEMGVEWAISTKSIPAKGYQEFRMFA